MKKKKQKKFEYDEKDFIKYGHNGDIVLFRVVASRDINNPHKKIKKGDKGGYAAIGTMSQDGECWLDADSLIFGNCSLSGDAYLEGSILDQNCDISGNCYIKNSSLHAPQKAMVAGNAKIENCIIEYDFIMDENTQLANSALLGTIEIRGSAKIDCCYIHSKKGKIEVIGDESLKSLKITGRGRYGSSKEINSKYLKNKDKRDFDLSL